MTKVLQFGEGNFLRTFVDHYFDTLNEEGGDFSVHIVKPIAFGSLENFKKQNNHYHIVLRGMDGAEAVEKVREIKVVSEAVDPFTDMAAYERLATDPEVKIIVSNTTEAGIAFCETDKLSDAPPVSYPAKLTALLYRRFQKGLPGFVLLLAGGISFTVGAVLYGVGSKKRWLHSVFHIFVVLGALLQAFSIFLYAL